MQIIFYVNNSDDKTVPKDLTQVSSLTGTAKEKLDILNPSILITSTTPITANYMYIPELSRYYFCTIEIVRTGIYRVTGHVDVLQSFWTDIQNCPIIAQESKNVWNAYIEDSNRKFFQYGKKQYITIGDIGAPTAQIMVTVG